MKNVVTTVEWLQRGRQRSAIARSLRKPMTAAEICNDARRTNPRVQLRDVWFIIRQLIQRKLVHCLNPRRANGQLYYLTDPGRDAVAAAFGQMCDPLPQNVNWKLYGDVVRGRTRRLVLEELGRLVERTKEAQTAGEVRRFLRNAHSVGLNSVIRALRELEALGLIRNVGVTRKQCRRLYALTRSGRRIAEQIHL